jgi:hypothetical protein
VLCFVNCQGVVVLGFFIELNLPSHMLQEKIFNSVLSNSKESLDEFRKKDTRSSIDGAITT